MSYTGHSICMCKLCDKVISQCRCFHKEKVITYKVCDECKKKQEEENRNELVR